MWKEIDWRDSMTEDENGSMMYMDPLHVQAMYGVTMLVKFPSILEIGCWDGFSTSAFVQAKADGANIRLLCCDINVRPQLVRVLRSRAIYWGLCQCDSLYAIENMAVGELVVLDGDHSLKAGEAEWQAIERRGWPTIMAHDCGTLGGDHGPQWLRQHLEYLEGWYVLVDEKVRTDMRTDRGLMLATRLPMVYHTAKIIFDQLAEI